MGNQYIGSSLPALLTTRIASSSSTPARWLVRVTPCALIDRARKHGSASEDLVRSRIGPSGPFPFPVSVCDIYPRQHSIHYLLEPIELRNAWRIPSPFRLVRVRSLQLAAIETALAPFFEHRPGSLVHVEHFAIVARMPLPRLR
jgi:hypothetical protein